MLAEIRDAGDRAHAVAAVDAFAAELATSWPKAVARIVGDAEPLLAFYDLPAEHWINLKTTNPIESTFATVRLPTKVTKGPGSRASAEIAATRSGAEWARPGDTEQLGARVEATRPSSPTPLHRSVLNEDPGVDEITQRCVR